MQFLYQVKHNLSLLCRTKLGRLPSVKGTVSDLSIFTKYHFQHCKRFKDEKYQGKVPTKRFHDMQCKFPQVH